MIAIYIDKDLSRFFGRITYTVDLVFRTLGYEYKYIRKLSDLGEHDILLYYSLICPSEKEAYILALNRILVFIPFAAELYLGSAIDPNRVINSLQELKYRMPVPVFSDSDPELVPQVIRRTDLYYILFTFDFFANIFFQVTGGRELLEKAVSGSGNNNPALIRLRSYDVIPCVNLLLDFLGKTFSHAAGEFGHSLLLRKKIWPYGTQAVGCIGHQVDSLQKWKFPGIITSLLSDLLYLYRIKYIGRRLWSRLVYLLTNIEEYWNFDRISELEKVFNTTSTFYISTSATPVCDYSINDEELNISIEKLLESGKDLALLVNWEKEKNDSFSIRKTELEKSFKLNDCGICFTGSLPSIRIRSELLNKYGFLFHYNSGSEKSLSIQRGMAFPYYEHYESQEELPGSEFFRKKYCLEIPVLFSDRQLLMSPGKYPDYEYIRRKLFILLENVMKCGGLFSLQFSFSNFTDIFYLEKLYHGVLTKLRDDGVLIMDQTSLARWWKSREAVVIEENPDGIKIYVPYDIDGLSLDLYGRMTENLRLPGNVKKINNMLLFSFLKADSTIRIEFERK
ncbi:MAG: hypothetical protein JXB60_04820 [Candidatus Cloacimonetes bacterium]|nr:hypothetical protein [Candidatus Cloacimonadota bacterium]